MHIRFNMVCHLFCRNIIRQCVNANKDDVVIFTGSGATSAIHKVIWALRINQPRVAEETVCILWLHFSYALISKVHDKICQSILFSCFVKTETDKYLQMQLREKKLGSI